MTPRPPRRVPLLVALSAAAVALVVGAAFGAAGEFAMRPGVHAARAADTPTYRIRPDWDLCDHVTRRPLAYFGATETRAKPASAGTAVEEHQAVGAGCDIEFDAAGQTGDLTVVADVFTSARTAHDQFAHGHHATVTAGAHAGVTIVPGLGSEAEYQRDTDEGDDPAGSCTIRRDSLVVRHGALLLDVRVVHCPRGTPLDGTALRNAALVVASDLMSTLRSG